MSRELTREAVRQLSKADAENARLCDLAQQLYEAGKPLRTTCREWVESKHDRCNAAAEFVLWGKLIPAEGLGPRCYDHAAQHVGHDALYPNSDYALIDLRPTRDALAHYEQKVDNA